MRSPSESEPREEELAALADGSLAPERLAAVEALAQSSPELAAKLEEQRRAVELMQGAVASVDAPAGLRARIEARRSPVRRRRFALAGGLGLAAAAAVAVALVLALPSNVPGGPSIAEAAAVLGPRPATEPPPPPSGKTLLARDVEGIAFPAWATKFGWEATGVRVDTIDGREATTVFYEKKGNRIAYTIVAGPKLEEPEQGFPVRRAGIDLRHFSVDGRHVVTWERDGHTCILSGIETDPGTLVKLAAWNGKGTVTF